MQPCWFLLFICCDTENLPVVCWESFSRCRGSQYQIVTIRRPWQSETTMYLHYVDFAFLCVVLLSLLVACRVLEGLVQPPELGSSSGRRTETSDNLQQQRHSWAALLPVVPGVPSVWSMKSRRQVALASKSHGSHGLVCWNVVITVFSMSLDRALAKQWKRVAWDYQKKQIDTPVAMVFTQPLSSIATGNCLQVQILRDFAWLLMSLGCFLSPTGCRFWGSCILPGIVVDLQERFRPIDGRLPNSCWWSSRISMSINLSGWQPSDHARKGW